LSGEKKERREFLEFLGERKLLQVGANAVEMESIYIHYTGGDEMWYWMAQRECRRARGEMR
jgi:hypothetical protein